MSPSSIRVANRLGEATAWAAEHLAGDGSVPPLSRALGTAAVVLEFGGDDDQAVAALLCGLLDHPDGRSRLDEIRVRFGERPAALVEGCSEADGEGQERWRPRKVAFLGRLAEASEDVLVVAGCARLHEVRALLSGLFLSGDAAWERAGTNREFQLWFERRIADILTNRLGEHAVTVAVAAAVRQLELTAR